MSPAAATAIRNGLRMIVGVRGFPSVVRNMGPPAIGRGGCLNSVTRVSLRETVRSSPFFVLRKVTSMRRFTRLTNGFSKKVENHVAAVALHFMHYNFARVHKSLRITPAMAAGVSDHVWTLEEIAALAN